MKIIKLFITLLCLLLSFWTLSFSNSAYAAVVVKVTEKIPWANCGDEQIQTDDNWKEIGRFYECTIENSFDSVMWVFSKMIKYATLIASLAWVLFIVINWIAISASWVDSGAKDAAKWRIVKTFLWLVILLLSWILLNIIAPWIYK